MKEWTVGELIAELSKLDPHMHVQLKDADTNWTIPKFSLTSDIDDNVAMIHPCDYGDMIQ